MYTAIQDGAGTAAGDVGGATGEANSDTNSDVPGTWAVNPPFNKGWTSLYTPVARGRRTWSTECCRKPCTPFQCEVGDPACLDRVRLSIHYAPDMQHGKPCIAMDPGGLWPCLGTGTLTSHPSSAPSFPCLSLGPFLPHPSFLCTLFILDKLKGTFSLQWAGPMVVK